MLNVLLKLDLLIFINYLDTIINVIFLMLEFSGFIIIFYHFILIVMPWKRILGINSKCSKKSLSDIWLNWSKYICHFFRTSWLLIFIIPFVGCLFFFVFPDCFSTFEVLHGVFLQSFNSKLLPIDISIVRTFTIKLNFCVLTAYITSFFCRKYYFDYKFLTESNEEDLQFLNDVERNFNFQYVARKSYSLLFLFFFFIYFFFIFDWLIFKNIFYIRTLFTYFIDPSISWYQIFSVNWDPLVSSSYVYCLKIIIFFFKFFLLRFIFWKIGDKLICTEKNNKIQSFLEPYTLQQLKEIINLEKQRIRKIYAYLLLDLQRLHKQRDFLILEQKLKELYNQRELNQANPKIIVEINKLTLQKQHCDIELRELLQPQLKEHFKNIKQLTIQLRGLKKYIF